MESDSDNWEPELMESQLLGHDPDEDDQYIQENAPPKQRGPKKIPPLWSRLISIRHEDEIQLEGHIIQGDIDALSSIQRNPAPRRDLIWRPIFLPSAYAKEHPEISIQ